MRAGRAQRARRERDALQPERHRGRARRDHLCLGSETRGGSPKDDERASEQRASKRRASDARASDERASDKRRASERRATSDDRASRSESSASDENSYTPVRQGERSAITARENGGSAREGAARDGARPGERDSSSAGLSFSRSLGAGRLLTVSHTARRVLRVATAALCSPPRRVCVCVCTCACAVWGLRVVSFGR